MADEPVELSGNWKKRKLPNSCIESTCHAMQCIANNKWETWKNPNTTTTGPGVWAAFGNKFICVSRVTDLQNHLTGVTDCNLSDLGGASLPAVMREGRGLILANSKSSDRDQGYNMHLGAVIASKDGNFIITDMSEEDTVVNSPIVAKELSGTNLLSGFRGAEYGDAGVYKFGVLICDAGGDGKFIAALRQKYEASGAEIIDEPLSESSDSGA